MIEVHDLEFRYHGAQASAVAGLAFTVERGEVFGFLGPSGAGKSTTQKILIRLLWGYSGHVTVLGRDLAGWSEDYYERVGVSFEHPNHFLKLTARENLAYFGALYARRGRDPRELLERVGLAEDADTPVAQFSKGMKGRLNVARALLHDPELLFLDEPTSGLDPVNARSIRELVREQQAAGRTVFLTTHNMAVADELCDRVAFIVDGRIALVGSPRELRLRHGRPTVRVEYGEGEGTHRREFPLEGIGEDAEFLALLRGGRVQTIHTQEATLEDVFIRVTGRSLG
ncbi:MAG TPA: ABC transporter ATP-binding protein [Longimicrobiaceae bacterium]|nr:ABC transporter ATP-binding protein [Longimicrobiaceae bacterium]